MESMKDAYKRIQVSPDTNISQHMAFSFSTAQIGSIIWAPPAGKRLAITDFIIIFTGVIDADCQLFFGLNTTTGIIFTGAMDTGVNSPSVVVVTGLKSPPMGLVDEPLRITTTANVNVKGTLFGRFE